MENNTLTAKEWLEKEELYSCTKEYRNKVELAADEVDLFIYMEKYANYKNKALEDKIKEYRQYLLNRCDDLKAYHNWNTPHETLLEPFDKHFNIK